MYQSRTKTPLEKSLDKAKAGIRVKQNLVKVLKEMEPDGLLSKEELFAEIDSFKKSVDELEDESSEFDEDDDN